MFTTVHIKENKQVGREKGEDIVWETEPYTLLLLKESFVIKKNEKEKVIWIECYDANQFIVCDTRLLAIS